MANPSCHLPGGWSILDAGPAYSTLAGVLGGFLFLGIITLMTEGRNPDNNSGRRGAQARNQRNGTSNPPSSRAIIRARTLMLFLPALLSLLVSSFLFAEVTGEQVCNRGYIEGVLAASLLAIGALGIFSGIAWMLEVYHESNEDLRRTSVTFTYISYFIVIASLTVSGVDIISDAFNNNPPGYALGLLIAYAPLLLISVVIVRKWFVPKESHRSGSQLAAVYVPAIYVVITLVLYAVLTSYNPSEWGSLNDWKTYLALSVALFFPAVTVIIYARALPDERPYQDLHSGPAA